MKLLESDRDRKVIEFSANEFRLLRRMSLACYEDYEDIEAVHLQASREDIQQVHDDLYSLLAESSKTGEDEK